MSIDKEQPIGAPVWFELATRDQAAAKRFYSELFGWTVRDAPIDENSTYTLFSLDGREVAACYTMMPDEAAQGVPSHWTVYFRVEDCDASTAQARAAGAQVVAEPFEVAEHLRMSVLADPEGAMFCLCQLRAHRGVGAIHETHAVSWVELASRDIGRAAQFYAPLLGWTLTDHASAPMPYRIFNVGGEQQGGLLQMDEQWGEMPAHWAIYLRVDDVDATLVKAQALGGGVCVPAFDAPDVGRIAMMNDPTGGYAYLIALQTDHED